jgi:hypothetical protein
MTEHKVGDRVYYDHKDLPGTLKGWGTITKIDDGWATLLFEESGKEGGVQKRYLLTETEAKAEGQ